MGQTKLGESKISHEAFSPLKVRFFREAMRLPITIIVQHSLTLNTAELLLNICDNHHTMVIVTHY